MLRRSSGGAMGYVFTVLLLLVSHAAFACDTYTSTRKPAGERVLFDGWLELTIHENGKVERFSTGSAGTSSGIQVAHPEDGSTSMQIVRKEGEFWLADERFVEYCQPDGSQGVSTEPDCNIYISELGEPGERTAIVGERGALTIIDHGRRKEYPDNISVGTDIPYRAARAADGSTVAMRFYEDMLIIDMEIFERHCGPMPAPKPFPGDPPGPRADRWAEASHACLTGEDRGGTKVGEEAAKAACEESAGILEDLKKAGYCRAQNGLGWVYCD
jgi:hypothetical protein